MAANYSKPQALWQFLPIIKGRTCMLSAGLLGTALAGPPVTTSFWTSLTSLQVLQLSGGGAWPAEFTSLKALRELTLANNAVGKQRRPVHTCQMQQHEAVLCLRGHNAPT
jgi:hypothetical protein